MHFWDDQYSPKKASFSWATFSTQFFKCAQKDNNKDVDGFNDKSEDHDSPSRRPKVAAGPSVGAQKLLACFLLFCIFPYHALLFLSETWAFPSKMHLKYSFNFLQYRLYMNFLQ